MTRFDRVLFGALIGVGVLLMFVGCSKNEVAFDTLETARTQAKDNALWVAQQYRKDSPIYKGYKVIVRGDSTQMPDCPQGDGWATVDFYNEDTGARVTHKCSTVSAAIGCMEQKDFETKSYASEDGHCQNTNKVPFPFRKIAQ